MSNRNANLRRFLQAAPVLAAAWLLAGCAGSTIKHDYSAFSDAYARDMNWQMLNNLARLHQGHPPYFVAVGEFKMTRTHNAGLSVDRTHTTQFSDPIHAASSAGRGIIDTVARAWKPSLGTQVAPVMSFIPMNSEETAKQLLQPMPAELFLLLYQQGWRIDHLLRVLVERIESPSGVLHNGIVGDTIGSYVGFLKACKILRFLQEFSLLNIKTSDPAFEPLGPPVTLTVTAKDMNDAVAQGRFWKDINGDGKVWRLGTMKSKTTLVPAPETGLLAEFPIVSLGSNGTDAAGDMILVFRSFRTVLEGLAADQRTWDDDVIRGLLLKLMGDSQQRRPILNFTTRRTFPLKQPVSDSATVSLRYAGRHYEISDDPATDDPRWNRDVFRLLVQVSSQVTIDISKFQRTVLQLGP